MVTGESGRAAWTRVGTWCVTPRSAGAGSAGPGLPVLQLPACRPSRHTTAFVGVAHRRRPTTQSNSAARLVPSGARRVAPCASQPCSRQRRCFVPLCFITHFVLAQALMALSSTRQRVPPPSDRGAPRCSARAVLRPWLLLLVVEVDCVRQVAARASTRRARSGGRAVPVRQGKPRRAGRGGRAGRAARTCPPPAPV